MQARPYVHPIACSGSTAHHSISDRGRRPRPASAPRHARPGQARPPHSPSRPSPAAHGARNQRPAPRHGCAPNTGGKGGAQSVCPADHDSPATNGHARRVSAAGRPRRPRAPACWLLAAGCWPLRLVSRPSCCVWLRNGAERSRGRRLRCVALRGQRSVHWSVTGSASSELRLNWLLAGHTLRAALRGTCTTRQMACAAKRYTARARTRTRGGHREGEGNRTLLWLQLRRCFGGPLSSSTVRSTLGTLGLGTQQKPGQATGNWPDRRQPGVWQSATGD